MTGEQKILPSEAKKMIEKGAKVVDVRTKIEWNLGHYPDAFHIPANTLKQTKLPFSKDDVVIVYCNTGQRARSAAEVLANLGYERVFYIASSYVSLL
jgi:rhodanese-related sulfurtransferase